MGSIAVAGARRPCFLEHAGKWVVRWRSTRVWHLGGHRSRWTGLFLRGEGGQRLYEVT